MNRHPRRASFFAVLTAALIPLLAAACGDPGPDLLQPDLNTASVRLALEEEPGAIKAGTRVNVLATVEDASGTPIPGVIINFVPTVGTGRPFAGSALTNASGEVREVWETGGELGTQTLEARAVDQATGDPLTFSQVSVTVIPGDPVFTWANFTGSEFPIGETVPFSLVTVGAQDAFGNLMSDTSGAYTFEGFTLDTTTPAQGPCQAVGAGFTCSTPGGYLIHLGTSLGIADIFLHFKASP